MREKHLSLVHLHLGFPLQKRHSSQLDVDIIDAFVEKVSGPLGNLVSGPDRDKTKTGN